MLPYRNLAGYLRERFGGPVPKIAVDAGFSCPNRDGTLASAGCRFCAVPSFSPAARRPPGPVAAQVEAAVRALSRRRPPAGFWVYFQPHTNTHGPLPALKEAYDQALREEVVALSVGTRPDCVPDPVLDLLAGYRPRREVWIELGLQSARDATLAFLRRGHGFAAYADAARRASARGLKVLAHVILGLPGESAADVRATARALAAGPLDGVKVHHLYVARGTALAEDHARGTVPLLAPREHAALAADFLERIPARVVVHRLVSDPDPALLVAPRWSATKAEVLAMITDEFRRRGTRQGSLAGGDGGGTGVSGSVETKGGAPWRRKSS